MTAGCAQIFEDRQTRVLTFFKISMKFYSMPKPMYIYIYFLKARFFVLFFYSKTKYKLRQSGKFGLRSYSKFRVGEILKVIFFYAFMTFILKFIRSPC